MTQLYKNNQLNDTFCMLGKAIAGPNSLDKYNQWNILVKERFLK